MNSASAPQQQRGLVPWKKGQSGNPKGRAPGSRNKLAERYCADFYEMWLEGGPMLLRAAAVKNPVAVVQVAASLLPKNFELNIEAGSSLRSLLEAIHSGRLPPRPVSSEDE